MELHGHILIIVKCITVSPYRFVNNINDSHFQYRAASDNIKN